MEPNLSQALHLLNGDATTQRIRDGGVVKALLDSGATPRQVVDELYVRCLARKPTESELARVLPHLPAEGSDPAAMDESLQDLFWALLNSKEFMFNH
jgi:hypothetical protein